MDLWSRMGRPQNIRRSLLLMAIVSYKYNIQFNSTLLCILGVLCAYMIVTTMNNLADMQVDRLNKRTENPLLNIGGYKKEATRALLFQTLLFTVCLILVPGVWQKSLLVLFVFLGWAYSNKATSIQSRGLQATVLLASCYVAIPYALVSSYGNVTTPLLRGSILCLFAGSILLAKDYKDLYGDKKVGKRTPLVRYGYKIVFVLAVLLCTLGLAVGVTFLNPKSYAFYGVTLALFASVIVMHFTRAKKPIFQHITSVFFMALVYIVG